MTYTLLPNGDLLTGAGVQIPAAADNLDYQAYLAWAAEGNTATAWTPVSLLAPVDPEAALVAGLQANLDSQAQALHYDDIATAITYRGDPNPRFAAEAEGFFALRSGTWTTAYAYLTLVAAGTKAFPTLAEAIAMMPALSITYPT